MTDFIDAVRMRREFEQVGAEINRNIMRGRREIACLKAFICRSQKRDA